MTKANLQQLAVSTAYHYGLDPALVQAVCHHESENWNPWAVRYEPAFYSRYIEKMVGLTQTEKTMRATSFGLMQVLGQVAREQGFDAKFLTGLLDPLDGINAGCKRLKRAMDKAHGDVRDALLDYNGGASPDYPDKVLQYMHLYQK